MHYVMAVPDIDTRQRTIDKIDETYRIKLSGNDNIFVLRHKINSIKIVRKPDFLLHTITVVAVPIMINLDALRSLETSNTRFLVGSILDRIDKLKEEVMKLNLTGVFDKQTEEKKDITKLLNVPDLASL